MPNSNHASSERGTALPTEFLPDDVDGLLAALAAIETEWADLAALHGNFGKYNDERKIRLAEAKLRTLGMPVPDGARAWTDDLRDSMARTDRLYATYVDDMIEQAREFQRLDRIKTRLETKIKSVTYSPVR